MNCTYVQVKTALRKHELPDLFSISRFIFSPYRACQHGCKYCDGRAEKYYVQGKFDEDIVVRKNIPEILEQELSKTREKGFICIGTGVSDPYQPIEKNEEIMRKCAEIISESSHPVVIMTKSSLVLRDLDIWKKINDKSKFLLMISLTFSDDKHRRIFEPGASSIEERLDTLLEFKKAGCATGVLAMPMLPFISESEENMCRVADILKPLNIDFCMPGGLTLRPGLQKDTFLKCIADNFPDLVDRYNQIYAENKSSGAPSLLWQKQNIHLYQKMSTLLGCSTEIPHKVYRGHVPLYDEIYLVLSQMKMVYSNQAVNINRLEMAINRYVAWIKEKRKVINRCRSKSYEEIDETLKLLCKNGEIHKLLNNEKLGNFVSKIVLERVLFNSLSLQLQ